MSAAPPRFLTYCSGGRDHPILARGPSSGPQVLILQPFFEEMNRCRSILADVQRGLAAAGIGSALVDLPGTGESEAALDGLAFTAWQQAVADAAAVIGGDLHSLAIRGGALLDGEARFRSRWRLSPVEGSRLLRELDRATLVSGRSDGLRAGYRLSEDFAANLSQASVSCGGGIRTIRLTSETAAADDRVEATPPWRLNEPARNAALSAAIVADVTQWIAQCGG